MTKEAPTEAELKVSAIEYLSWRDHSVRELQDKLLQKGGEICQVQAVILWCQQENYQSEWRFCQMLVRAKANKGYGPAWISQAARQHGLAAEMIREALQDDSFDWFASALTQYQKKFGDKPMGDYHDKQKRMAFLQRRGFSSEHIREALQHQDS